MATIDIGLAATNRASVADNTKTHIQDANPANLGGVITSVEVWANSDLTGFMVGTFYGSGGTWTCRDSELIGAVTAGSKQTFTVSILCSVGDCIGFWSDTGQVETDGSGSNSHQITGQYIDPTDTSTLWESATYQYSVYGTGLSGTSSPTVSTQATSAVAATTATGNGTVVGLGDPEATQYGHVWATYPSPGTSLSTKTSLGVPAGTGAFTSAMTGLVQNTLYYTRAYITNDLGTFFGINDSFTTSGAGPVVTTLQPTEVSVYSALGQGSIDNLGGTASLSQYGVCWDANANPSTALATKTQEGVISTLGVFYTAMTGLTAASTIHVRAYGTNASSTGYGADLTFTTLYPGVPIVTTQSTQNIQQNSATGRGTIIDIGASSVTQHGHVWGTSINPNVALTTKTSAGTAGTGAFTSAMTGLAAGTTYYARAYATNSLGTGYGNNETINDSSVAGEAKGIVAIYGETLIYMSKTGLQYYVKGVRF